MYPQENTLADPMAPPAEQRKEAENDHGMER